ncbi:hypothetical protein JW998_07875, partial [candidate division KSB1 bacterium]|nr:hypothetical protein [candidate division KSB1 bacterium]
MKKTCFFLLLAFAVIAAKERQEITDTRSVSLKKAESKSAQVYVENKFTHPQHVRTLSLDEATQARLQNDLDAVLQTMKKIRKPARPESGEPIDASSIRQNQNLEALRAASTNQDQTSIYWNKNNGTPIFMHLPAEAKLSKRSTDVQSLQNASRDFLQSHASVLSLENPADELQLISSQQDDLGHTHLRYQQYYQGVKVWGADLYVHFDAAGQPKILNGRYVPTPEGVSLTFDLSQEQAVARASAFLGYDVNAIHLWQAEKVIYIDDKGRATAAWHVELGETLFDDMRLFVDARDGDILHWYNNVQTGTPGEGSGVDMLGQTRTLDIYNISGTNY